MILEKTKRIVSLVPSLTETICQAGLESYVVGITQFCVSPTRLKSFPKVVGGTKDPNIDLIKGLKPTHVLANLEENESHHISELAKVTKVLVTKPRTVIEAIAMLDDLGDFLGEQALFSSLSDDLKKVYSLVLKRLSQSNCAESRVDSKVESNATRKPRFLYFIWRDPWMVASSDTYISDALQLFGFENAVMHDKKNSRYPQVALDHLNKYDAQLAFFSSEPWPFRRRDVVDFIRSTNVSLDRYKIDGKIFSWYGSSTKDLLRLALRYHEVGMEVFNDFDV